jgi:hypothetical protein
MINYDQRVIIQIFINDLISLNIVEKNVGKQYSRRPLRFEV